MRLVINVVLALIIAFLFYVLYSSIQEPIQFQSARNKREHAVIDQLVKIRQAQEIYRSVEGAFSGNFDTLKYVLRSGKVRTIKVEGDPDDPTGAEITYDTIYEPAMKFVSEAEIKLDSLEYVPFGKGTTFDIQADTLTYQSTMVNVVEVGTVRKNFMGEWASPRFARYDNSYNPNSTIKFGDMNSPNVSGNWER